MTKRELIKRYTELHGKIFGQRKNLFPKVASLIKEMDYQGITDRCERELKKISFIEKEIGQSKELDSLRVMVTSLFNTPIKIRKRPIEKSRIL